MMARKNPTGEMPFLDHLEELRWRILWSLLAVAGGAIIGFVLVQQYDVLALLKGPIAPFLPDGKLTVIRPTDAFLITLKLAVAIGVVLAAPVILAQLWAFVTPALYEGEKRFIVPALIAGLGLFVVGAVMAYLWVLPLILRILFSFQHADLQFMITADSYFGFAAQMIIAFGLLFELPLVIVLLGALGLVSPDTFARHRPIALVIGAIVAAVLTPPDALSMMLMMLPIVVLYELGIFLARLVGRRRAAKAIGTAALALLALTPLPTGSHAQQPERPRAVQGDTAAQRSGGPAGALDTAAARRLGLPTAPSRMFPPADSVIRAMLRLQGYVPLRYAADSITLHGATSEIVLMGSALVEREGSVLEADTVRFLQDECRLRAAGSPALFDQGTVLTGEGMRYDTCLQRGTVPSALTSFTQSGVRWYLRGGLELDSASTRVYGASTNISSCELPTPHYHFGAGSVKWVSNTVMVARPAVLYVRDVPVLWLPFIVQDMREGRRSGLLVPRFGFSDLVRPNTRYRRHVSNIGYYVALNDYTDVEASLDWFAGNYVALTGRFGYRWLDRFVQGQLGATRILEEGREGEPGGRSLRLQWAHQQSFDQRTRLTADVDYATSARVVERNSVDPFLQTARLGSRVNFSKQFGWGTVTLGASRSQELSSGTVTQTLPSFSLSPASGFDLGRQITWSPSVSVTNSQTLNQAPGVVIQRPPGNGDPVADTLFPDTRNTSLSFNTPLRIGRWNWPNSIRVSDFWTNQPPRPITLPDPDSPGDSITVSDDEDFQTEIDWDTGINLPILFPGTWKLQPTVGIRNSTAGAFLLRNRFTDGEFVSQGKRLTFAAGLGPTLFGFFPGIGPIARIRHAVSPRVSWDYAPPATVPEAYARAVDPEGRRLRGESPALHSITFGLSQTFEGKLRPPPGDTTSDPRTAGKLKLLSIQTSAVTYDFEQAKEEGRSGWRSGALNNSLTSDLLPGFSLSLSHDLWDGPLGHDTTRFDPFLTSVSARFSLSGATLRNIWSLLSGRPAAPEPEGVEAKPLSAEELLRGPGTGLDRRPGLDPTLDRRLPEPATRGRGVQAAITYDDQRRRPVAGVDPDTLPPAARGNRTVQLTLGFPPTANWSVAWNTLYNFTTGEFGQHVLRLERDLHRWRATFQFLKAPNGNFAFNFFIALLDQPEIKFDYDQRTVRR